MDGKEAIAQYEEWYMERYGKKPSEFLINRFCTTNNLKIEEQDEEAQVEEVVFIGKIEPGIKIDRNDEELTKIIANQSIYIGMLLRMLERYMDKLSPADASKVKEIIKEVEGIAK